MLPDKQVKCHRTGFRLSCYTGVTKHKCRLWCHVSGTDAMDRPVDVFGCSDALEVKLIHEVAKEVRQAAASADKVATEVRDASGKTTELQAMLVNGVKATMLPLLNYASDVERLRLEAKEGNGG